MIEGAEELFGGLMHVLPIALFSYLGGTLTLSVLHQTGAGLGRIRGSMDRANHLFNSLQDFLKSTERILNFYTAPEAQKLLVNKVGTDDLGDYSVQIKGNFTYGVSPVKDYDEKKKALEKIEEKYKKAEEKRIKELPLFKRMLENLKLKRYVKHELKFAPRTLNEISHLKNIDLNIKKGEFVIIIGKIQAGKSSLMKALVGELMNIPQRELDFVGDMERSLSYQECRALEDTLLATSFEKTGSPVNIAGSVSYVEQQHWIQNATARDNILFGSEFDQRLYAKTVKSC